MNGVSGNSLDAKSIEPVDVVGEAYVQQWAFQIKSSSYPMVVIQQNKVIIIMTVCPQSILIVLDLDQLDQGHTCLTSGCQTNRKW